MARRRRGFGAAGWRVRGAAAALSLKPRTAGLVFSAVYACPAQERRHVSNRIKRRRRAGGGRWPACCSLPGVKGVVPGFTCRVGRWRRNAGSAVVVRIVNATIGRSGGASIGRAAAVVCMIGVGGGPPAGDGTQIRALPAPFTSPRIGGAEIWSCDGNSGLGRCSI